jgi:hypothetical protein
MPLSLVLNEEKNPYLQLLNWFGVVFGASLYTAQRRGHYENWSKIFGELRNVVLEQMVRESN